MIRFMIYKADLVSFKVVFEGTYEFTNEYSVSQYCEEMTRYDGRHGWFWR